VLQSVVTQDELRAVVLSSKVTLHTFASHSITRRWAWCSCRSCLLTQSALHVGSKVAVLDNVVPQGTGWAHKLVYVSMGTYDVALAVSRINKVPRFSKAAEFFLC